MDVQALCICALHSWPGYQKKRKTDGIILNPHEAVAELQTDFTDDDGSLCILPVVHRVAHFLSSFLAKPRCLDVVGFSLQFESLGLCHNVGIE